MTVKVGLIDSSLSSASIANIVEYKKFVPEWQDTKRSNTRHGDEIVKLIKEYVPECDIYYAQIFGQKGQSPVDRIVDAVSWLVSCNVDIINMSFGMRTFSESLKNACHSARAKDILLLASAPARGGHVFPASFTSCLSVSGDARCGRDDFSWLGLKHAEFGANPSLEEGNPKKGGGASYACARFSGLLGRYLDEGKSPDDILGEVQRVAKFRGPERRLV